MSTVQDEADPGPNKITTEVNSLEDETRQAPEGLTAGKTDSYAPATPTRQRPIHNESQLESPKANGDVNGFDVGRIGQDGAEQHGEDDSVDFGPFTSPSKERPSSADGSVSTPDDTPSLQASP